MPMIQAFPLGLILEGTTSVFLADGSTTYNLVAGGKVTIDGTSKIGSVLLDTGSNEVLVGMDFLRQFKKSLYVSTACVLLMDEKPPRDEKASTEEAEAVVETEAAGEHEPDRGAGDLAPENA